MKRLFLAMGLGLVWATPAIGQVTGCWDIMELSDVDMAYAGPGPVSLLVVPNGTGLPLTEAWSPSGTHVDATITVTLRDCMYDPIASFPREDLWLEATDGGLYLCQGGSIADANTDANGITNWTAPLMAGGTSEAGCVVMVNGAAHWKTLPLRTNSPDINHDLQVNLVDVVHFAGDFFGTYQYRSDFQADGILNLLDVVWIARSLGAHCP